MKVAVRFFARARDLVGSEHVDIDLPGGGTIAELRSALGETHPELRPLLSSLLFAIGADYASEETSLSPGEEVVCFPPVSGG